MTHIDTSPAAQPETGAAKERRLFAALSALDSVVVALSGGADSAYLAWAAHRALGDVALAVTALSASFSAHDREQCEHFVRHAALRHEFVVTQEFENPLYVANNADRCYFCKSELFERLDTLASARGFAAIAYGINADDMRDFRPGQRAAAEHRALTPLLDAGLSKAEIRQLSHAAGLPTWDRPASPCLSSRIPYGTPVTREALHRVERGEAALRALGFREFRVRHYSSHARVEIAAEELPLALAPQMAAAILSAMREVGYASAEVDPRGYRAGSLNEALKPHS